MSAGWRMPTPDELRVIERAHHRSVARRKLPIARAALAAARQFHTVNQEARNMPRFNPATDASYAQSTLRDEFGDEWEALTTAQRVHVLFDFCQVVPTDRVDPSLVDAAIAYHGLIRNEHPGYLARYADTLAAGGERRRANRD